MADSTYRVGVLLDLAAGRFRRGTKAAAKDTDRLGGSLRKAAGSGSLMGRRVTDGARRDQRTPTGLENLLSLPAAELDETPSEPAPLPVAAPAPPPEGPAQVRVQIFRGGAREEVTLEK